MSARSRIVLYVGLLLCVARELWAGAHVTSPKEYFGFNVGDDYCLANYKQLAGYWGKIAGESDRIKIVPIGLSEEGRTQLMAVVSSPDNLKALVRYEDISRRLARAENVSPDEARDMALQGKSIVWIDGGLHASEVLGAQQLIETVYQMLSGDDEETKRILNDDIILFVHCNPDGMDLCSDWYMRQSDPKKRTLAGLPRLWQKYIGHDNNRDFYANNMSETRNMNRVMYLQWFPQIVYNHHQAGPPGSVLFCPPFRDPFNYNINPLVISGIDAVGASMMQRFLVENKPGATVRSGMRYSTWWNGGLRTTCYFHNMIGLLTETIGSPTPMQIPFNPAMQLPKADYLAPIAPQPWHLRQSVDYSVTANKSVLDYASRHREQLLYDIWLMGHNAIDAGSKDSWTITPKLVEAAKKSGRAGGATAFNRLFRDPAKRDPRGYVIPSEQPDFLTATKFVNKLLETGIKVHRATSEFDVKGKEYPAGSYVVRCAQAFRAHVLDMFEPQDHPNDFAYPGAPPTPPYDIAGYTLAFQMGVKFDRILEAFDGPFEELEADVSPPAGVARISFGAAGYILDTRMNDSFIVVNRMLKAGIEVRRLPQAFESYPAGSFFISDQRAIAGRSITGLLRQMSAELGTSFFGVASQPERSVRLKPVRIGLWDRYGGSMPSGWTRWVLERFEFPFKLVFAPELDKGNLRDKFDVLIFVDGAISGRGGGRGGRGNTDAAEAGDANAEQQTTGGNEQNIPEEFRGRQGNITAAKTVPQLKRFFDSGGTLITIGSSTGLAYQLGLPLKNHLVEKSADGTEHPLSREKFYVPGSLLSVKVDSTDPLAWGEGDRLDVMFTTTSPAFRLPDDAKEKGVHRIAWYDSKTPLRSGWAWGQEHLDGGVAIAEADVGKGKLVLFGPEVLFRGQPHGTFKLFFNAILQAGAGEKQ